MGGAGAGATIHFFLAAFPASPSGAPLGHAPPTRAGSYTHSLQKGGIGRCVKKQNRTMGML